MNKYFGDKVGINKDILRHREAEAELIRKIGECEISAANGDKLAKMEMESYKHLLRRLYESKAEMASKLFKKG